MIELLGLPYDGSSSFLAGAAEAPGVSHHEPGGLTTRELIRLVQRIDASIVGADIVECNPVRDLNGVTAMVAAKLLRELLSKMLQKAVD